MIEQRPELLYHFTCRTWWHFIKQVGIDRGEAPTSRLGRENWPNLTSNLDPQPQGWAVPGKLLFNKTAVRIAVRIPPDDDRLVSFRTFADSHGMDRRFYQALDRNGGWQARYWWLYRGLVVPEWFVDVEFLDNGEIGIHEQKALEIVKKSGSFDEAIRRMGGRHNQDFSLDLLAPELWNLD
jgi:hypothetical protein